MKPLEFIVWIAFSIGLVASVVMFIKQGNRNVLKTACEKTLILRTDECKLVYLTTDELILIDRLNKGS
jgi:hypothetical protein